MAREARFELADLIGSEHVAAHAARRHDVAVVACAGKGRFGRVDLQPSDRTHEIVGAGQRDQLTVRVVGARHERQQRVGDRVDAGIAAREQEAQQPRCDAWQVTPAYADGAVAIEQDVRDVVPQGRGAVRHHRAGDDAAGVAERGCRAGGTGIDQRDAVAVALQMQRAGYADDAGTDDGDA